MFSVAVTVGRRMSRFQEGIISIGPIQTIESLGGKYAVVAVLSANE
jgi:hypothetical protein